MNDLPKEIRERTIGYIMAAFGLVAGLAWNDAISALIRYIFPIEQNGLIAKFFYAIVITVAAVAITMYMVRALRNQNDA